MQTYDIKSTLLFRLLIGDTAKVQLVGSCAKSWHITSYEWHSLWENCFRFADERESLYHCMIVVLSWVRLEYITGLAPDNTEFQSAWSLSPQTEDTGYRIHSPALLRASRVSIVNTQPSQPHWPIHAHNKWKYLHNHHTHPQSAVPVSVSILIFLV